MNEVAGYKIDKLPYEALEKVQDILYADGPILTHYRNARGKNILFYWVDFNEVANRWLIWETNKKDLFDYLSGGISLFEYLNERCPEYLFIADMDNNEHVMATVMLDSFAIPEAYYPNENSYFTLGLPIFYDFYLSDGSYISRLRERSYVFNLKPNDVVHATTVAAKEAGQFLINITKSIESYVDITATDRLKNEIGDRGRLNRTISQLKQRTSPRIADTLFGSFEVSIAMDTVALSTGNAEIDDWSKDIITAYQNDVLDVDYSSEEDAVAIIDRFPDAESRKKIFDPIFKILENPAYSLTVSAFNSSFKKDYRKNKPAERFKEKVLPKQTIEEILNQQEQKAKLVTAIFRVPEGGSISDLRKKELLENLLFTQEGNQPTYPITSPIIAGDLVVITTSPIECALTVDNHNHIILAHTKLGLYAEGADMKEVVDAISRQFVELYQRHLDDPGYVDEKTQELDRLVSTTT